MENKYTKIEFGFVKIEDAVELLNHHKSNGLLVYGKFNDVELYSDIDDLDSAYKKITGKTKVEFDNYQKELSDKYNEEERKHKESIPKLTKEWIEKGKEILDEKYHDTWIKCVPIRLNDLYRGFELGACLDIVKELNAGCDLNKAKDIIESQGHSGMSFGLVCSMVKSFCDRSSLFVLYVR